MKPSGPIQTLNGDLHSDITKLVTYSHAIEKLYKLISFNAIGEGCYILLTRPTGLEIERLSLEGTNSMPLLQLVCDK